MRIKIVAIGKMKEKWLQQGVAMYVERLSKYCRVECLELPDASDSLPFTKALSLEAQAVSNKINLKQDYYVLLDLHGKAYDSLSWANEQAKWLERSGANLTFVIGGSRGLADELRSDANVKVKLSDLTFTHQMTRLVLLEQIYRAFKINNGETYHK